LPHRVDLRRLLLGSDAHHDRLGAVGMGHRLDGDGKEDARQEHRDPSWPKHHVQPPLQGSRRRAENSTSVLTHGTDSVGRAGTAQRRLRRTLELTTAVGSATKGRSQGGPTMLASLRIGSLALAFAVVATTVPAASGWASHLKEY